VARACNPGYSGGREQEDHGSKPAQANSSEDPISKIPVTKVEWLKVKTLSSSPSTLKKKKKKHGRVVSGISFQFCNAGCLLNVKLKPSLLGTSCVAVKSEFF
jgi:hypothetical protein